MFGKPTVTKHSNKSYKFADGGPVPNNDQIRLNQMIYDRRLAKGRGEDTMGDAYPNNAEIDKLRKSIRGT